MPKLLNRNFIYLACIFVYGFGFEKTMWRIVLFLIFSLFLPYSAFAETLRLNEARVLEMALAQNLGVKIADVDREIGRTGILEAKSIFDTTLNLQVDHQIDKRDQAIPLFGTDNRTTNFNLGLTKTLPTGTQAGVNWTNQRNSTNSPFATANPYYESTLGFSLRQPVLNNVFGRQDRGHVEIARRRFEAADFVSQRRILESVYQVLVDYWKWRIDQENLAIARRSVDEAERFEKVAGDKLKLGLAVETDVLAARANRIQMENELRNARREEENSRARLRRGLDLEDKVVFSSMEKIDLPLPSSLDQSLTIAFAQRADYKAARSEVEARKIELMLARNRKWPSLDLLASLRVNGVDQGYGTSLGEVKGFEHPAYIVGGEFRFPLENRLGRSAATRSEREKTKALLQLKQLENRVATEVEEQWREAKTRREEAMANREIEGLLKEKWRKELDRFETGRSSSDLVTRFQLDYLKGQQMTLLSLLQYRVALLGLKLAENTL